MGSILEDRQIGNHGANALSSCTASPELRPLSALRENTAGKSRNPLPGFSVSLKAIPKAEEDLDNLCIDSPGHVGPERFGSCYGQVRLAVL